MKKILVFLMVLGLATSASAAMSVDYWTASLDDSSVCKDCSGCKDGQGCKDCKDCKNCKQCKDCCGDCKDCKDCRVCKDTCGDCKDCKGCKSEKGCKNCLKSSQAEKARNTYAWMVDYVLESGGVFNKLDLSKQQKTELRGLMSSNSKNVMGCAMKTYKDCGECPITALQSKKYKNCAASSLCVSSEVVLMVDKPLRQKIKAILTKQQFRKYENAVTILNDYTGNARKLMKTGEAGWKKLSELYSTYRKQLDETLPAPAEKTAKVAS